MKKEIAEKREMFKVIGLVIEKYIGRIVEGHNCHFNYEDAELERYHLFLLGRYNQRFELTLWEEFGECGSGWTTAVWGCWEFKRVPEFGPFTHRPIRDTKIELPVDEYGIPFIKEQRFGGSETEAFSVSEDGGDEYYPWGWASVNMDIFQPLKRAMEKRPVYILHGPSGIGKSTLAFGLKKADMTVYETDSVDELPEVITDQVIVLGNRSGFTVEDVKKRIFGDARIIEVAFSDAPID